MLKELLSSRRIQGGLVFVVLVVVGSMLYSMHVEREGLVFRNIRNVSHVSDVLKTQETREKARTDKIIEQFQQGPAVMPSEAEPLQGGHYHGDESHASELGGWAPNSDGDEWHAALPPSAVPDDIPDRYKLPDAWKALYAIGKDGRTNPDIPLRDIVDFCDVGNCLSFGIQRVSCFSSLQHLPFAERHFWENSLEVILYLINL